MIGGIGEHGLMWITGDPEADALLDDPFALLIGMLLDQQVPMEAAFAGPHKIAQRMGGLDPHRIAEADPQEFTRLCSTPPAVHRFPGSMAARIQALAHAIVTDYATPPVCTGRSHQEAEGLLAPREIGCPCGTGPVG